MTHRTNGQEVTFVTLIHSCTILKKFTANHSGCAHHNIILSQFIHYNLNGFLTCHRAAVIFAILQLILGKCSFANNQCIGLTFLRYILL